MTPSSPPGQSLIEYPCAFPIKVMGLAADTLSRTGIDVVLRHAPDFNAATMVIRSSSAGKYLSLTCTINATSRAQLDALYRELSSHPLVKFVL